MKRCWLSQAAGYQRRQLLPEPELEMGAERRCAGEPCVPPKSKQRASDLRLCAKPRRDAPPEHRSEVLDQCERGTDQQLVQGRPVGVEPGAVVVEGELSQELKGAWWEAVEVADTGGGSLHVEYLRHAILSPSPRLTNPAC
jgi:hypothetical protein